MAVDKFKQVISKYKRVGLDSMEFIYFLEDNSQFGALSEVIFELAERNKITVISSILVLIEVLTGYRRANDETSEQEFKQMMKEFPNIEVYDLNNHLINKVVDLRTKYNIKTPDAIHIATAIENKAEAFITNDKLLSKIKEIKIICLSDF